MLWSRTGSKVGQIAECVFRMVSWGLMLFKGWFAGTTGETVNKLSCYVATVHFVPLKRWLGLAFA